jgi:predicted transcriptional regulator
VQLFPNFAGKSALFTLATWVLAVSYLIGGYWLFNQKDNRYYFLPITAGLAFAVSIIAIPLIIRLGLDNSYYFFPILNLLLCIGLTVYAIKNRNTNRLTFAIKSVFKRSIVILAVSSLFTYTPISFKPYRHILIALNNGDEFLINNLLMFDYIEECEKALDKSDCDRAIVYAEMANKAGKIWLGIRDEKSQMTDSTSQFIQDLLKDSSNNISTDIQNSLRAFVGGDELYKISGTYTTLYRAYKCKADAEYDSNQFSNALNDYEKAHISLTACNHNSKYWNEEMVWSFNNIAFCYKGLNRLVMADSFYVKAINKYKELKDSADNRLAKLYSNLALSLSEELLYGYSNDLFQAANGILRKDTANKTNRNDLVANYIGLARNYLIQDSLEDAMFFIKRAMNFVNKGESEFCSTTLYYGVCLYRLNKYQEADSILKTWLQCYQSQPDGAKQNVAECYLLLGQVNIALAKYDDARKYVNTGIEITERNFGSNSSRYANYLQVLAHLNKVVGDYPTSHTQYNRVIEIYSQELSNRNYKLPRVLAGLADLEIILSNFNSAKQHSDSSLAIAENHLSLTFPSTTNLLNDAAYVEYCLGHFKLSNALYRKVISINENYGLQTDAGTAIALNGLGLIETARKNYKKADSLFIQSLELHKQLFTDNNPVTAIVYLNFGTLCIQENKLVDADQKINKALAIERQFFKDDHDIFADIFVALGDLADKQGQKQVAQDNYKKALDIYKKKFNEGHWKIVATQRKRN